MLRTNRGVASDTKIGDVHLDNVENGHVSIVVETARRVANNGHAYAGWF